MYKVNTLQLSFEQLPQDHILTKTMLHSFVAREMIAKKLKPNFKAEGALLL